MRKQHVVTLLLTAGLLSACSPQSPSDSGANAARPAAQTPAPQSGGVVAISPGDVVAGVVVADLLDSCPSGALPYRTDRSLTVDPVHPDRLYVGVEGAGVFRSIDRGATWQPAVAGLNAHYVSSNRTLCFDRFTQAAVDPRDSHHLCVTAGNVGDDPAGPSVPAAIYCSVDDGVTWSPAAPPSLAKAGYAVAFDPRRSGVIVAGISSGMDPNQSGTLPVGSLLVTANGGQDWARRDPLGSPAAGLGVTDIAIAADNLGTTLVAAPVDSGVADGRYEGEQFGVLRSLDSSSTFAPLTNGMITRMSARAVRRIATSAAAPARLIVLTAVAKGAGGPYLYYSDDGGESFRMPSAPAMIPADLVTIDPSDAGGLHALAADTSTGHVYETLDGGDHFTDLGAVLPTDTYRGPVRLSNIVWSSDPQILYASGSHAAVYRSTDGGHTWSRVLIAATLPEIVTTP